MVLVRLQSGYMAYAAQMPPSHTSISVNTERIPGIWVKVLALREFEGHSLKSSSATEVDGVDENVAV